MARSRAGRIVSICLWSLVLVLPSLFGQGLPTVKPEAVGLSGERLERIGAAVQREIDGGRLAGAVTLVARRGKVAWLKSQGQMDRESGRAMPVDAIFRICSMSKPITSAAVMELYEEGRFLLSDPVSRFLPEFKDPKVLVNLKSVAGGTTPANREITIRQLLTHTAGLVYQWHETLGPLYRDANVAHGLIQYDGTIGDSVRRLASLPLLFAPGERFEYSLSIDVLGRLVEVVSGMSLDRYFQARVFGPLGMKDTHFFVPDEKVSRMAAAYTYYDDRGLQRFPDQPIVEGPFSYSADYPYRGPRKLFSGGAGLCSTVADYARFCQMLLNGGQLDGRRVLSRKSVEMMRRDQLGASDPNREFGLGFGVWGTKTPAAEAGSPGKYGWGGFFYTRFFIDPEEELFGVFMAQLHPTGGLNLHERFEVLALQAIID